MLPNELKHMALKFNVVNELKKKKKKLCLLIKKIVNENVHEIERFNFFIIFITDPSFLVHIL